MNSPECVVVMGISSGHFPPTEIMSPEDAAYVAAEYSLKNPDTDVWILLAQYAELGQFYEGAVAHFRNGFNLTH